MDRTDKFVIAVYAVWTAAVVLLCLLRDGLSPDNITRLLVIGYLAVNLAWYLKTRERAVSATRTAFVLRCSLNALAVEFFYMFSRPVFSSLLFERGMPVQHLLRNTLIDFTFTFPAYLVIFSVVWALICRYRYRISEYALLFSFAQAVGDGNAFFRANPAMLLMVPYVMLNYQAANLTPFLRVREALPTPASERALKYALPLVLIPAAYWVTGALIVLLGRAFGLA